MVPAFTLALPILLLASPAWAHPVPLGVAGLSEGILHPIMGLDHLLAMVAVGLLAATAPHIMPRSRQTPPCRPRCNASTWARVAPGWSI